MRFKPGDEIECIDNMQDNKLSERLTLGKIYVVQKLAYDSPELDDPRGLRVRIIDDVDVGGWYESRFVLAGKVTVNIPGLGEVTLTPRKEPS